MKKQYHQRLRKIRLTHSLDIKSMADLLGIDQRSYQDLENGSEGILTAQHLHILYDKLNVNANFLLFGIGPICVDIESHQAPATRNELNQLKQQMSEIRNQLNEFF